MSLNWGLLIVRLDSLQPSSHPALLTQKCNFFKAGEKIFRIKIGFQEFKEDSLSEIRQELAHWHSSGEGRRRGDRDAESVHVICIQEGEIFSNAPGNFSFSFFPLVEKGREEESGNTP